MNETKKLLKMSELVTLSGESKSTILYYIKEGLLPEPHKIKANVHKYDEQCIEIIKLIKYLQNNFSYSIAEIKTVFERNNFDFSSEMAFMHQAFEMIAGGKDNACKVVTSSALQNAGASYEELQSFIHKGYLIPHKIDELSFLDERMLSILKQATNLGIDTNLFDQYVNCAKELAQLEFTLGAKVNESNPEKTNEFYKLIFDVLLHLKPYIFNKHTIKEHQEQMNKDT